MTSYFDFDVPATCSEYNSDAGYQSSQPSSTDNLNDRWRQDQDSPRVTAGLENALAAPKDDEIELEEYSSPVLFHAPIPWPAPIDFDAFAQFLANPGTDETLTTPFSMTPFPTTPFPTSPSSGPSLTLRNAQVPIDFNPYANDAHTKFLPNSGTDMSLTTTFLTPSEKLRNAQAQGIEHASPSASSTPSSSSQSAPRIARNARFRAMAVNIGFTPTNPDTITAHLKKRHYLECLEEYVLYLHEQIKQAGFQPTSLERVSAFPGEGLRSRSIRTILVHMQNEARTLNLDLIAEEKRFLTLRDTLLQQQAAERSDASDQLQATSADCM